MTTNSLPSPTIVLSKTDARRFLLAHQRLWPPRQLHGKPGIVDFIRHVGCIQFDPIDVVGRNPDLVLQSRVAAYRPPLLQELLYVDRHLLDGWDKVASIHLTADWPHFARYRAAVRTRHDDPSDPVMAIAPSLLQGIRERGPLSSNDFGDKVTIRWWWGQPTRLSRAAFEILYAMGEVGIHHRVGTRRIFDLSERLLPAGVFSAPDPHATEEEYQNWHVLRRVGGIGLAHPGATEYWLAMHGVNGQVRRATLARLVERGDLAAAAVDGLPDRTFFLRTADLPTLEAVQTQAMPEPQAAVLAPLDNLLWDRALLRWLFDFDYTWEVYKPAAQRKYGYYVLPVLHGDRFVARFEPVLDKKTRELTIRNWWWEEGVGQDERMQAAIEACLRQFRDYLEANQA